MSSPSASVYRRVVIATTLPALAMLLSGATAVAKVRPITTYQWVDSSMADISEPNSHTSKIIYLNRCSGGCTISPGFNDSRSNHSSIVRGTASITEWGKGDTQWDEMVQCVTALYDPYDIIITDVDPGAQVEHFEAIVAGKASEIGQPAGVGGIAPFTCGIINNAITFNFANSSFYANGIKGICETVGQETAHAFGLEHEYLCTDPMTYLSDCGLKWFQDESASCGEFQPSNCRCRSNQNSHRILADHFGPGEHAGPDVQFVRPLPNSNVEPNFVIEISGDNYYYGLKNVEVLVGGQSLGVSSSAPYIFNAPETASGFTTIEVRGTDARGIESSQSIEVNVGQSCSGDDCPGGRVCYRNFCIDDASTAGGFSATCETDAICNSKLCAKDLEGVGMCTETCEVGKNQCPSGYGCLDTGPVPFCWEGISEGGNSGCTCTTARPVDGLAGFMVLLFGFLLRRRRRLVPESTR